MKNSLVDLLGKPEYLYQPARLLHRLFGGGKHTEGIEIIRLPWDHLPLEVNSSEAVGRTISHHGFFEFPVVEAIFRLVDSSDIVLDVGANIGYMAIAAISAGARKVISFEPHPEIFARLSRNKDLWIEACPEIAGRIDARQEAITMQCGTAALQVPKSGFAGNQGISSLEVGGDQAAVNRIEVTTTTLDSVIRDIGSPIGVLKIDVEGHELKAISGGMESLRFRKIRDIIYEDFVGITSDVSQLLLSMGYSIFGLETNLLGPVLLETPSGTSQGSRPNFFATLDPMRAKQRMTPRGFVCLKRQSRLRAIGKR